MGFQHHIHVEAKSDYDNKILIMMQKARCLLPTYTDIWTGYVYKSVLKMLLSIKNESEIKNSNFQAEATDFFQHYIF